jgi:hypothetical protein
MITPDADQNTFFVMDDMHDLPNDRSECLLAVLGYQIGLVEGLLLREADFNGTKVYKRFGHFQRFFANSDGTIEDWKTYFTHGERCITLY